MCRIALTPSELAAISTLHKNITPLKSVRDVIESDSSLSSYVLLTAGEVSASATKIVPNDHALFINDVYWQQGR